MADINAAIEDYKAKRQALGEEFKPDLIEERDRLKRQRDELLEAVEAHRANAEYADDRLYILARLARRIRREGNGE